MQQFFVPTTQFYPDRPDPIFSKITRPGSDIPFSTRHNTNKVDMGPLVPGKPNDVAGPQSCFCYNNSVSCCHIFSTLVVVDH